MNVCDMLEHQLGCHHTKYLQHYLAWFRYIDSKEYENTISNMKHMLVKSCLKALTVC